MPLGGQNSAVVRHLYRSLLKAGHRFDNCPVAKAMIYVKNPSPLNGMSSTTAQYYMDILGDFLRKKQFFHPAFSSQDNSDSLCRLIKTHFRKENDIISPTLRIDAAFVSLRKLSNIWRTYSDSFERSNGISGSCGGNKVSTVGGVVSTAVKVDMIVDDICVGMTLVAHPLIQGPLHRTVIILLEHNEHGSYGIVINKPTDYDVQGAVANLPSELLKQFGESSVSYGGPVRRLQYLHSIPSCGGIPVPFATKPLFAGGSITKALAVVRKNKGLTDNFKFFVGCCTWDAGQLEEELRQGFWLSLKSPSDILVSLSRRSSNKKKHVETAVSADKTNSTGTISALDKKQQLHQHEGQGSNLSAAKAGGGSTTDTGVDVMSSPSALSKMVSQYFESQQVEEEPGGKKSASRSTSSINNKTANLVAERVVKQNQYSQRFKNAAEMSMFDSSSSSNANSSDPVAATATNDAKGRKSDDDVNDGGDIWQVVMDALGAEFQCLAKMPMDKSFANVECSDWWR